MVAAGRPKSMERKSKMEMIYKWALGDPDHGRTFSLNIHDGAQILAIQTQHGKPMLWAQVDHDNSTVRRKFIIFGTGIEISIDWERLSYIGTWQDGGLVWHLCEMDPEYEN